jgi:hypothetical protein
VDKDPQQTPGEHDKGDEPAIDPDPTSEDEEEPDEGPPAGKAASMGEWRPQD